MPAARSRCRLPSPPLRTHATTQGLVLCLLWNLMGTVAVLIGVGGDNLTSFLWAGTGMCAAQEHMHPIFRLARAPACALQGCPPAGSQSHPCRPLRAGWCARRAVAVVPSRVQGAPPASAAAACRPAFWAAVRPPLSHPPPFGLRQASISDSALRYALFFALFLGHLVFCGWSAVAPPILNSWSHTGWYSAYNGIWPRNRGAGRGPGRGCGRRLHAAAVCRCAHLPWPRCSLPASAGALPAPHLPCNPPRLLPTPPLPGPCYAGIIYYVGAALWSVEFLWSFWTLKHVCSSFRGRGLGVQQAKQEAAAGAIALTASSAV